jgi:hypothetical protein
MSCLDLETKSARDSQGIQSQEVSQRKIVMTSFCTIKGSLYLPLDGMAISFLKIN